MEVKVKNLKMWNISLTPCYMYHIVEIAQELGMSI